MSNSKKNSTITDGAVEIDTSYLKQRKVYGHLIAHFRYGREKDEVMGIKFYRDFVLASTQIYPTKIENQKLTNVQVNPVFHLVVLTNDNFLYNAQIINR